MARAIFALTAKTAGNRIKTGEKYVPDSIRSAV